MPDFTLARERMVESQIARRGVRDSRILEAFRAVPRERFVESGFEEFAYEDGALPIDANQTISQPYIVALMIEAAELAPASRVLEVGAGSGYAAAVMSRIAAQVYAIERHASLVAAAQRRVAELGYDNIELRVGDGTRGWPDAQPFDAILVAASGPEVPQALKEQLAVGGHLVIPIGEHRFHQTLCKITRISKTEYDYKDLGGVAFVPLIGEQGWADEERHRSRPRTHRPATAKHVRELIAQAAEALPDIDAPEFARCIDRYANRRVVLLGEA